jgi:hypothetical protein
MKFTAIKYRSNYSVHLDVTEVEKMKGRVAIRLSTLHLDVYFSGSLSIGYRLMTKTDYFPATCTFDQVSAKAIG